MAFALVRLSVSAAGSSQGFWVLMTHFVFGPLDSVIMSLKISLKEFESHCFYSQQAKEKHSFSKQVKGFCGFCKHAGILEKDRRDPVACKKKDSMTARWVCSSKLCYCKLQITGEKLLPGFLGSLPLYSEPRGKVKGKSIVQNTLSQSIVLVIQNKARTRQRLISLYVAI